MNIENRKFIVFAGYWQQLNIYKENELNEFKRFLFGNIKSNISKDIGIHIRGGDFLRLNKSLGMSFYDKALNQFKCFEPVTIFTNDKKYSKEILPKSLSYQFSENDNLWLDIIYTTDKEHYKTELIRLLDDYIEVREP